MQNRMMTCVTKLYCHGRRHLTLWSATYAKHHLESSNVATLTSASKMGSYIDSSEPGGFLGTTIGNLIDLAPERFGDQLAVIDCAQGIRKSHLEMNKDINKVATGFLALNLQRGDRIAIWSPNRYEWVLTQMAAAKAGLILVTLNPSYQPNEFAHCLGKVGIRAVVFPESFKTQNYHEMILKVVPEVADSKPGQIKSKTYPKLDTLIALSDKDFPGSFNLKEVMNAGGSNEKEKLEKLQKDIQFDDVTHILFTSGTTGKPKAATHTHFGLNSNCLGLGRRMRYFDKNTRVCCAVPLFHSFGCVIVSITSIVSGSCTVLPSPGFSADETLKSIERERCTSIAGVPTMFRDILDHPNFKKTDFSSLKSGMIGGAPSQPNIIKEIIKNMQCPGLSVIYGATELSMVAIHDSVEDKDETKCTTVGSLLPNTEAKIVDFNDKIVPMGTSGEICIRGNLVMKGYWEDEEKTKEVIKNGWYHTGDIGTITEDGHLTLADRIKDMIIRGGENICPTEIEDFLISHPKISDVYVIGVPDERMGEDICAWIKLKANETMTENEVKEFCKGQIAHFKIPRYIRMVNSFPLTMSGKIQKFKMREEMAKVWQVEARQ